MARFAVIAFVALCVASAVAANVQHLNSGDGWGYIGGEDQCDQQTKTYYSQFKPVTVEDESVTVTPFFSPDDTTIIFTELIEAAETSIDIGTPHFKSWIECGDSYNQGCTVDVMRNGCTDPIWAALLNAYHRGVKVRILSNFCDNYGGYDYILPLEFLHLAGIEVVGITSVSFQHSKYIQVDGDKTVISSINLSKSSMTENREAGMIIEGSSTLSEFFGSVFDSDFASGYAWHGNKTYSSSDMAIIKDTSTIPVPAYPKINDTCTYVPDKASAISGDMTITAMTMPDYALDSVIDAINDTQSTFWVFIYVIDSWDFCYNMKDLYDDGIDVKILVSSTTVGGYTIPAECYKMLYEAGLTIRYTQQNCLSFYHQKVWSIDDKTLWLSTGNWADQDFPSGDSFAPGTDGTSAYRGYTVAITDADVVTAYSNVFWGDYNDGYDYYPPDE